MKSILKSVRMTEELYSYVDSYRGEGFSNKFNYMVLDSLMGEQVRIKRFVYLDKQIAQKQEQLQNLGKQCEAIGRISYSCSLIERQIEGLVKEIDLVVSQG